MTNTNVSPRFDGSVELTAADVERLPYVSLLPGDFTDRLERLKEASGLSWSGFAKAIGIDYKQMYRWHNDGVEPSGGATTPSSCSQAGYPEDCTSSSARGFR